VRPRGSRPTRPKGELPGPDTDVFMSDTMAKWALYRLAPVSLVLRIAMDRIVTDHNPFEAAALGIRPSWHGPFMFNFADIMHVP